MAHKKYVLLLLSIYFSLSSELFSQPLETWFQSIDPNPVDEFQTDRGYIIESHENFLYLVSGYVKESDYGRVNNLIKIDANSKEVVKMIELLGPQGDNAVSGMVLSHDGYLLLTGEWKDLTVAPYRMKFFIAKYTLDLEEVWTKYYPDFGPDFYYSDGIVEMTDGNIMLSVVESYTPSPSNNSQLRLVKTDASGNYLSTRLLEDTLNYTGGRGSITVTADSNYFVSSYCVDVVVDRGRELGIMHKVNSDMEPLWTRELNRNVVLLSTNPRSMSLRNGNQVVLWFKDTITSDPQVFPDFSVMYCYGPTGIPLWTKEWNQWVYDGIYGVAQAANGDILGLSYFDYPSGVSRNVVFRLNEQGEQIWERRFSDSLLYQAPYRIFLADLCELADGRIAIVGISLDTTSDSLYTNANVALLVLDAEGCLEPGCSGQNQYITDTWTPIATLPGWQPLRVTPNPAGVQAQVKCTAKGGELWCYNAQGALQARITVPLSGGPVEIQVSDWPAGQYFILHRAGGRLLGHGKLVVQR